MQKTIATIAIALAASTAHADMSNPVTQMKIDNYFDAMVPVIKLASACDNRMGERVLEDVMSKAYALGVSDSLDQSLVNMAYQTVEMKSMMDRDLNNLVKAAKQRPDHPKVMQMCKDIKQQFSS